MAATVTYEGFAELRQFLADLPETVKRDVRAIVLDTVDTVDAQLHAVYPPGEMAASIQSGLKPTSGAIGVQGYVLSPTPQAHWWEFGTVVRATQQGWNRGSEPAHPDRGLITLAVRHRKTMYADIFAMLERLGFTVVGWP